MVFKGKSGRRNGLSSLAYNMIRAVHPIGIPGILMHVCRGTEAPLIQHQSAMQADNREEDAHHRHEIESGYRTEQNGQHDAARHKRNAQSIYRKR